MKIAILLCLALVGCGTTTSTVGPDPQAQSAPVTSATADDAGTPSCPPRTHTCACATGTYCLAMGAMCIAPDRPCPTP